MMLSVILIVFLAFGTYVSSFHVGSYDQKLPNFGQRFTGGRIVGGDTIDITQVPWQLSLLLNGSPHCGAVIISESYALTAAHCTNGRTASSLSVSAGSSEAESGQIVAVGSYVQYSGFNIETLDGDISILILANDLVFGPGVAAITLPHLLYTGDPPDGTGCYVSGWGSTSSDQSNPIYPTLLQGLNMTIVSRSSCNEALSAINPVTQRMICAGGIVGQDACQGDSGGPLVCDGRLQGIVSWGVGCAQGTPAVFTDVGIFRVWIFLQIFM